MSDILKMCKTVVSSLRKKPFCQMYPFKPAKFYDHTRGHIKLDASKCILCSLCAKRCPTGAIEVDRVKGSWQINRYKCIMCIECVVACPVKPVKALAVENQYAPPMAKMEMEMFDVEVKKPAPKPAAAPAASTPAE
ncbi:MAG TPA: hypothetical protein DD381_12730 [Lentisphaeria bacterium]|nr:MAG: hypothetical protein A2X47_12300 [Lentisphaerae bacterium GWF2_38_69]HBM17189.1 hypothetical protein [Lentisphaeria bacterium]